MVLEQVYYLQWTPLLQTKTGDSTYRKFHKCDQALFSVSGWGLGMKLHYTSLVPRRPGSVHAVRAWEEGCSATLLDCTAWSRHSELPEVTLSLKTDLFWTFHNLVILLITRVSQIQYKGWKCHEPSTKHESPWWKMSNIVLWMQWCDWSRVLEMKCWGLEWFWNFALTCSWVDVDRSPRWDSTVPYQIPHWANSSLQKYM